MFLMEFYEPIIIVVVVSFVAFVIFLAIYSKKKGKNLTGDCTGDCKKCGGSCKINLLDEYKKSKELNRYIFYVEGMKCGMCETHLNDAVRKRLENATNIKSNRREGTVSFVYKDLLDVRELKKDFEELGYRVIGIVRK